jgi:asparagine synthase (glutamine-hydrolysing)
MCGISGKLMFDREAKVSRERIKAMATAIRHRGPDDEGYYLSGQIGLGFRRLSIIDLGTGHQPISNEDERIWVVFNGEIYNYQELRRELVDKGHAFKTLTDTEVLVHLYEEYGPDLVVKLRGMFAFALWDENKKLLFLTRDRVGIKPLYYCLNENSLCFGSEVKALLADPDCRRDIDPTMIDRFLTFYYMPGEETLFKNIFKLPPGSYLIVRDGKVTVHRYWDLNFQTDESLSDEDTATERLLNLLDSTVGLHMISDVPVGFLLSGGVDSTAILSFAAGKTEHPTSSYTVGFSVPGVVDERPYARMAAKRFGTEHHELEISSKEFSDFLPSYVWHMEEPVCEPPAVALYYVSKLASSYVKVLISGEGGDEAFAGYSNYRNLLWLERLKRAAGPMCSPLSKSLMTLNALMRSRKIAKYASMLSVPLQASYYSRTSSPFHFFNRSASELYSRDFGGYAGKEQSLNPVREHLRNAAGNNILNTMLYVDTMTWLPDDLLVKADKMTMANSVELRVPFLDHKVLEFAAALPASFKVRGWTTKYLAKKALTSRVPTEILDRKKAGFPVPYESWLRTDLHDWMRDILLDRKTMDRGYFEKRTIENLISNDLQVGGYSKELFSLVVLELWHRAFLERPEAVPTESPAHAHDPVAVKNLKPLFA